MQCGHLQTQKVSCRKFHTHIFKPNFLLAIKCAILVFLLYNCMWSCAALILFTFFWVWVITFTLPSLKSPRRDLEKYNQSQIFSQWPETFRSNDMDSIIKKTHYLFLCNTTLFNLTSVTFTRPVSLPQITGLGNFAVWQSAWMKTNDEWKSNHF